jgi:cell wall-associated NlpC family hydrolase
VTTRDLDPRLNAYRDDLAAEALRGEVAAPRFAEGEARQVTNGVAPVRRAPRADAGMDTEVLFGETVTVYDEASGWCWVQLTRDGYVGYVPATALGAELTPFTHRVSAVGTFVYPVADIKTPPLMALTLNAKLTILDEDERFARLAGGGYVISRHIAERGRHAVDFVEIAERFIGSPYLWGGRTRRGIDCSGLVQVALEAAGIIAPRDSDMQQSGLGEEVLVPADLEGLQRGDLVFWRGHVGIMTDSVFLLHANAHHMATAIEPLGEAVGRNASAGSPPAAIKRLSALAA